PIRWSQLCLDLLQLRAIFTRVGGQLAGRNVRRDGRLRIFFLETSPGIADASQSILDVVLEEKAPPVFEAGILQMAPFAGQRTNATSKGRIGVDAPRLRQEVGKLVGHRRQLERLISGIWNAIVVRCAAEPGLRIAARIRTAHLVTPFALTGHRLTDDPLEALDL